jgi:hypothetical protein
VPLFGPGRNKKKSVPAEGNPPARPAPPLDLPAARHLDDNGDPALGPLLDIAAAHDWPGLRAALTEHSGNTLTALTNAVLRKTPEIGEWLPQQLKGATNDAFGMAVLGRCTVNGAWKVRSGKKAQHVSQDQFKQFHAMLREAEEILYASVELDPASVFPWYTLLDSAMGLQMEPDVKERRFAAAIERCPGHLGSHSSRLQQLCRKWGGSHELMHEFATAAAGGPHADRLCILVPRAYYEHHFDLPKDSPERKFIQSGESRAELKELAERTIFRPGYRPNPRNPAAAANMFGWAFAYAGLWPEAKAAYAATAGIAVKWAYFSKPVAEYDRLRTLAYRNG